MGAKIRLIFVYLLATTLLGLPLRAMTQDSAPNTSLISLAPSSKQNTAGPNWDDFVGTKTCAKCHTKQYKMWRDSVHGKAGGAATAQRIIPVFKGTLHFRDAEVKLENPGKDQFAFVVKTVHGDTQRYRVDAVVGGGYISGGGTQAYFTKLPDGSLRYLAFDYSVNAKAWFCQTGEGWLFIDKKLSIDQCLSWPPKLVMGQHVNFDHGCLDCHGSQIQLAFDTREERYRIRYKSLSINCESCHGPGKRHVALARSGKLKEGGDSGLTNLKGLDKEASVRVCLKCHAKKTPIDHGGHAIDNGFKNRYALFTTLSVKSGPLLPTGRIRDFSYQESHLFSACYRLGTLTCTNCHDPHDQGYRDLNCNKLSGPQDDRQCTTCHTKEAKNPSAHSHHPPESAGNHCIACHMPSFQQPGVGDHVPYARVDHSISIPRPALEARMGVPNACAQCHPRQSPAKLDATLDRWYGQRKPLPHPVKVEIQAFDGDVSAESLLNSGDHHPPAQLADLSIFIYRFLKPDMDTLPKGWMSALKRLSRDANPDIKAAALAAIHLSQGDKPAIRAFLKEELDSLGAQETAIRRRWAYDLNDVGDTYKMSGDNENARRTYEKVLEIDPKQARILTDLGGMDGQAGDFDEAITKFRQAIAVNPEYAPAYFNLGIALSRQGHIKEAQEAFHQAELRRNDLAPPPKSGK